MAEAREKEPQDSAVEKTAGNEEDLSLEESFKKLDGLLDKLEDREIPLEEAFTLYQQGVELMRQCNEKIDTVEKKIQVLNGDGELDEF